MAQPDGSITLIQNLDTICPVDNPMVISIATDNQFAVEGVKAKLSLKFSEIDTNEGRNLILTWGDRTVLMVLKYDPDDSGTQMHAATTGQSLGDWVAVLCSDLNSNYYLAKDFLITVADYVTIVFEAKLPGAAYTLNLQSNPGQILGISEIPAPVDGVDPVLKPFYAIGLQVLSYPDNAILGEDLVTPNPEGVARFDIHDLLCDYLTPEFSWPQPADTRFVNRDHFIRQFTVRYGQTSDRQFRKMHLLYGDHYAILGGFDYKMLAGLNGTNFSIAAFVSTQKSFLTWQPEWKSISCSQKDMLFFLNIGDHNELHLFTRIYFTDGSSTGPILVDSMGVQSNKVYELLTGYETLSIASYLEGKVAHYYMVWLQDENGNALSIEMFYFIDFRYHAFERSFIFRNSFGAYDCFRATGRKKNTNHYERMILDRNFSEITVSRQYQILESESFTVNTGYINKASKNWLREMLLSEEVYEIIGDLKFPILIQNDEMDNFNDLETVYDLDIVYKYAFKNPKYSGQVNIIPLLAENLNILLSEDGKTLFA